MKILYKTTTREIEEEPTTSLLHHIRQDPGRIELATMLEEMAKLRRIRELKLPDNLFPGIARKVLMTYWNRASIEEPSRLRARQQNVSPCWPFSVSCVHKKSLMD
jgi:hypothetical protein